MKYVPWFCNLFGSMKEFMISANVSAETLALPTTVGSLFMHFSHVRHGFSIAGTRELGAQRFSK